MPKSRHTEIAIEVEQTITVRRRRQAGTDWCSGCGARVIMVTLDEATSVVRISSRAIVRMVETGQIHFVETDEGLLRLCFPSLLEVAFAEKTGAQASRLHGMVPQSGGASEDTCAPVKSCGKRFAKRKE